MRYERWIKVKTPYPEHQRETTEVKWGRLYSLTFSRIFNDRGVRGIMIQVDLDLFRSSSSPIGSRKSHAIGEDELRKRSRSTWIIIPRTPLSLKIRYGMVPLSTPYSSLVLSLATISFVGYNYWWGCVWSRKSHAIGEDELRKRSRSTWIIIPRTSLSLKIRLNCMVWYPYQPHTHLWYYL
jgi:hypothetical protein